MFEKCLVKSTMPSEGLPLVITSGLGVGVFAGVVSGICYVFIQGLRSASTRKAKYGVSNSQQCSVCGAHFHALSEDRTGSATQGKRYATCSRCYGRACRNTCGQWVHSCWLCIQCVRSTDQNYSWFRGILTAIQPRTPKVRMSKKQINEDVAGARTATGPETQKEEKEIVRDFIERLVGAMLGSDVDNTSVNRLYKDKEYDAMFDRYHSDVSAALTDLGSALHISISNLPASGQTPCNAHASLKNIIKRVLRDAANMALLKEPQNEAEAAEVTTNRTYEDLLATAILNKVIDNYQTELRRPSSGSNSSKKSDTSKKPNKKRNKRNSEERWREDELHDIETSSISSLEEWCRSESSGGSKYVDHMSFTIKQSIEEITTSDEESGSQQYLHSHNLSKNSLNRSNQKNKVDREDWQDNWLFSRKGKCSPKPVPVPMLVPNPSTDYRALIGDKDAEDTSDLSETGSDLDEPSTVPDIKTILIDSRTIIGGKNLLENISPEVTEANTQTNGDETVKEIHSVQILNGTTTEYQKSDTEVSEAKNNTLIHETAYEESDSLGSNTEKDAEYTEKYASFPRQISKSKSPVPSPRTSKNNISQEEREELIQAADGLTEKGVTDDAAEEEPPIIIEGSYSKKEKEKWRNPIALENNPYSKENLDKRLHGQTDNNLLFGRDYYIRQAKKAAGGRSKSVEDSSWIESSELDLQRQKSVPVTNANVYERSHSTDQNLFKAVPAVIHIDSPIIPEYTDEQHENKSAENHKEVTRPASLALSTDSDDTEVKRVYNIETGNLYKIKERNFTKVIIQDSKSPEGIKQILKSNEPSLIKTTGEIDATFDENHNESGTEETESTLPKIHQTVMKISALNHLIQPATEIEIQSKPDTEIILNNNATESFILHELSNGEAEAIAETETEKDLYQRQVRDVSKKYLESLVKSVKPPLNKADIINSYATPPISLQEYTNEENEDIDSAIADTFKKVHKSCIDLRFVNKNQIFENEGINDNEHDNVFIKSTNLDEREYHSEDNDEHSNTTRIKKVAVEEEFSNMPSVKDLRKLFDKDKTQGVKRSTSNLTTKPEIYEHKKQVHSLTARSLPKTFRRELQKTTDDKQETIADKNDENIENEPETNSKDNQLEDIPTCKTKIAFFEFLNK